MRRVWTREQRDIWYAVFAIALWMGTLFVAGGLFDSEVLRLMFFATPVAGGVGIYAFRLFERFER
jgi:hypothetical protein